MFDKEFETRKPGIPSEEDWKRAGTEVWDDNNTTNGDGCSFQRWWCYSNYNTIE